MLRDGAGSSSDTHYAGLPRIPAQVHGRSPDSTTNSPDQRKTRATIDARLDVEARLVGVTRGLDIGDNLEDNDNDNDNDNRQRLDIVNQHDDMYAYLSGIPVVPDDAPQQMFSCVANGRYYKESDVAVLAAVLKGFDITEIFSPERVTKLCKKYHLVPGDFFDLRTRYDLSDEKT